MSAVIIPHIVEQHAEESAFLWILRDNAVKAPHYRLKDLAKLEGRVEAHVDGLRVAGDAGWQSVEQALAIGEAGEVFVAAMLALESRNPERLTRVLAVAETSPSGLRGLTSALGWQQPEFLVGMGRGLLQSDVPLFRILGFTACGAHRVDPKDYLTRALNDQSVTPAVKARAARTAGQIKRRDLIYCLRDHLVSEDEGLRYWAAWAAVLMGDREVGLDALKAQVIGGTYRVQGALELVAKASGVADVRNWLKGLAQIPDRLRQVITAVGFLGDPAYVPWLTEQMEKPDLARVAGEAFSMITGVDLAYQDLERDRPEGFESGPSESPEDEDVEMDDDENLPWPDPAKIGRWWQANASRFQAGERYLAGLQINRASCRKVLLEGYQRQRTAAALELALLEPDKPLFETRAPASRQKAALVE